MKENPIIVPVQIINSNLNSATHSEIEESNLVCQFKINSTEAIFYNVVDKQILHTC